LEKRDVTLLGEELFENLSSLSNHLAMTARATPETRNFSGFEIVFLSKAHLSRFPLPIEQKIISTGETS
jgi:hypothetical protein